MRNSTVLEKIKERQRIICGKASFHHPEILEFMCRFEFDAIWMCHEHKRVDHSNAANLIRICRLSGKDAIIRVNPSEYSDILWLLEAGANGIMLPKVTHIDQVKQAVKAMKFPPLGERGFDGIGPDADFAMSNPHEYLEHANRNTFLIVQIEEREILNKLDDLASLTGVDILFVGPKDLSLSLGCFDQPNSPEINDVLIQVAEACAKHGKTAGIPSPPAKVHGYEKLGFNFFNVISDFQCMSRGLLNLTKDLQALPQS